MQLRMDEVGAVERSLHFGRCCSLSLQILILNGDGGGIQQWNVCLMIAMVYQILSRFWTESYNIIAIPTSDSKRHLRQCGKLCVCFESGVLAKTIFMSIRRRYLLRYGTFYGTLYHKYYSIIFVFMFFRKVPNYIF